MRRQPIATCVSVWKMEKKVQAVNTATGMIPRSVAVFTAFNFKLTFHTLTHVAIGCHRIRGLESNNLFVKLMTLGRYPPSETIA